MPHRSLPRRTATAAALALLALVVPGACKRGGARAAADSASAAARADSTAASDDTLSLPAGPWHLVAQDEETLVAIDTSAIVRRSDGDARVRLHYAFAQPRNVPGRPELTYQVIRSEEVTECARATSHPSRAVLLDSAGKEIGRATRPAGPQPAGMIGNAGGALCAYLRSVKKVR